MTFLSFLKFFKSFKFQKSILFKFEIVDPLVERDVRLLPADVDVAFHPDIFSTFLFQFLRFYDISTCFIKFTIISRKRLIL